MSPEGPGGERNIIPGMWLDQFQLSIVGGFAARHVNHIAARKAQHRTQASDVPVMAATALRITPLAPFGLRCIVVSNLMHHNRTACASGHHDVLSLSFGQYERYVSRSLRQQKQAPCVICCVDLCWKNVSAESGRRRYHSKIAAIALG